MGGPALVVTRTDGSSSTIELRGVTTIGRDEDNDIVLGDPQASRRHAEVRPDAEGWAIVDLGSRNGTLLNGAPVAAAAIASDDEVLIGAARFRFVDSRTDLAEGVVVNLDIEESVVLAREELADAPVMTALYDAGRAAMTAQDIEEVMLSILRIATSSSGVHNGALLAAGPDGLEALVPSIGSPEVSTTIVEHAITTGAAVVVVDAASDERLDPGESIAMLDVRSAICVPVWADGDIHGALYLDRRGNDDPFKRSDVITLSGVANLLALRIRQEQLAERLLDEQLIRARLARFFSPDVVDAHFSGPQQTRIELDDRVVTVLMADIEGFTTISETLSPRGVVDMLNTYLDTVTNIVFGHGGTVISFIGDGVLAAFGAPTRQADHADRAVTAAFEIIDACRTAGEGTYRVRVAVHTGPVVVGEVGATSRSTYTVLGDTVNVTSRLEKHAPPDGVAWTATTHELLTDPPTAAAREVRIRGREATETVYTRKA